MPTHKQPWMGVTLAALCLGAAFTVRGETWTNAAGHAIEAQFVSLENEVVSLRLTNGSSIRLPLASLAESEQVRARRAMGREEFIPAVVLADVKQFRRTVMRLEQLHDHGLLSDDERQARRAVALASLRKACLREKLDEARMTAILKQARGEAW